ncbi:UNKNOWN [Stylonychia lemnae]|uniref:Uncharacterized protein n=1 Tax=Stylonychia lemnae TaxID=5949 RepID=A0A078A7S1_STYLE|nr:UNKNOWN [Stylonychia lemnae]|eukprot:CDW77627.1 UNKNOWN [Stylonychia lemnae]
METPDQKLQRAEVALQELNELYNFAETLYPIERTMGPRNLNENLERRRQADFHTYRQRSNILTGTMFWGTTFFLVMARCSTGAWNQIHVVAQNPRTALLYFAAGAFVNYAGNIIALSQKGVNHSYYFQNKIVASNHHTHAVIKTTIAQLQKRRMSIWDSVPN